MADNNVNVIQDQDIYGAVRFFGSVEIKPTASFLSNVDVTFAGITATGNIISNGNIQGQTITASVTFSGILRTGVVTGAISDPPTEAELVALLGSPVGGQIRLVEDAPAGKNYIVTSFTGTAWSYAQMITAL